MLVKHQPAEMCLISLENTVQKMSHISCLALIFIADTLAVYRFFDHSSEKVVGLFGVCHENGNELE